MCLGVYYLWLCLCSIGYYFVGLIIVGVVAVCFFFFQAEDGIRDLVRSRGLGDVYKRQVLGGIGSLPGAMLGGLLIGLIESFWAAYLWAEYLSLIHI